MEKIISEWLVNMRLCSLSYSAYWFSLRFERDSVHDGDLPEVLNLEILSEAYFGSKIEWGKFISQMPQKPENIDNEFPALSYKFMCLMNNTIKKIELQNKSELIIHFSNSETLKISGTVCDSDISWSICEPSNERKEGKFISCDNSGEIRDET